MVPAVFHDSPPLLTDAQGVIRIGGSRVSLDTLVAAFRRGASAEQIADDFPSLALGDIYAAIGYYLRHRGEVETYLAQQAAQIDLVRQEVEQRFPQHEIRDRLLAKLGPKGKSDAEAAGG